MLHEHPQTNVIGEDGLATGHLGGGVRHGRVQHGQQEARLRLVLVTNNVPEKAGHSA